MTDLCVVCDQVVRPLQHALSCDACERWQHRNCNTGISRKDYFLARRSVITLSFTCSDCERQKNVSVREGPVNVFVRENPVNLCIRESPVDVTMELSVDDSSESEILHSTMMEETSLTSVPTGNFSFGNLIEESSTHGETEMDTSGTDSDAIANASVSIRVDASSQEPVPVLKESLSEVPAPRYTFVADAPVSYEMLPGMSRRGKDILVDSIGYMYNVKERYNKTILWRCSVRNKTTECLARVRQVGGDFYTAGKEHVHAPVPSSKARLLITKQDTSETDSDVIANASVLIRVDASSQEQVPVLKESLSEVPAPRYTFVADAPVSYEMLPGMSRRGKDILVDSIGYMYNVKERYNKTILWRCSVRNKTTECLARVRQVGGDFYTAGKEHIHAPVPSSKADLLITKQDTSGTDSDAIANASVSIRVDASSQEPVPVLKESLSEVPAPRYTFVADAPVSYEMLPGMSRRGKDILVDSIGYMYNVKERYNKTILWRCSVRNKTTECLARVRQVGGDFYTAGKEHIHAPVPSSKARLLITKQATYQTTRQRFTAARSVVNTVTNDVDYIGMPVVRRNKQPLRREYLQRHAV